MKLIANTFLNLAASALLPMAVVGLSPLTAAPVVPSAGTNAPQSVFVMPDSPKEGRDPFFPNSIHPYQEAAQQTGRAPELSALKLEGITRGRGHFFAIINDVTFGVADEADVKTPTGSKIHVRCDQIKENSVVVEAGGKILTLILSNQ
jgi:hypothetical protein